MNILLVAEESAGLQTLRMLLELGHPVGAVLTSDSTSSRGATVGAFARRSGVPLLSSNLVMDKSFAEWINAHAIDLLLNIHSLFVIHEDVVAAPDIGSFNLHPGPLPEYAGLNAPSWAIYYGEETHRVTVHWMEPGIDTGALAYEDEFPITEEETGLSLSLKCIRHGLPLVRALIDQAARDPNGIPATAQDLGRRRYFGGAPAQDGRIEWRRPAAEIDRFVRAADYSPFDSPWGHPTFREGRATYGIAKAALTGEPSTEPAGTVGTVGENGVLVAAADEWIEVQRLEHKGAYVPARDILNFGSLEDG